MNEILITYGSTERLELEANQRLVNMENNTALHEAVKYGHFQVVQMLIQRDLESVMLTNFAGESPLFLAVDKMRLVFIQQSMEKCPPAISEADYFGWTPLHCAAHLGAKDIAEQLLLANNSIAYIKNEGGMTALHIAAKEGQGEALVQIAITCPDIWDLQVNKGQTALHVAVKNEKVEPVKFILELVSEDVLNQQDNDGNTRLHLAGLQRHHKILELLLKDQRVDKMIMSREGLVKRMKTRWLMQDREHCFSFVMHEN